MARHGMHGSSYIGDVSACETSRGVIGHLCEHADKGLHIDIQRGPCGNVNVQILLVTPHRVLAVHNVINNIDPPKSIYDFEESIYDFEASKKKKSL